MTYGNIQARNPSQGKFVVFDVSGTLVSATPFFSRDQDKTAGLQFQQLWNESTYAKYENGIVVRRGDSETYYQLNPNAGLMVQSVNSLDLRMAVATDGDVHLMGRILHALNAPRELTRVQAKREFDGRAAEIMAVVDDEKDSDFVTAITRNNPEAKHFLPNQGEDFRQFLRGTGLVEQAEKGRGA